MALLDQRSQMLLDRVAAGTTDPHGLGHRDPAVLARQFQDQHRQFRQGGKHYSLALHLLFEAMLLAPQGPQEELQPGVPVGRVGTDRSLRPSERQVVALLALLDHALQRTVRHIGIARPQQQQRRQDTGQPAVAVLKGMDFQKHHDEGRDDQQRVKAPVLLLPGHPFHQLGHAARRVEGRGGLEHHAKALAIFVEGFDVVGKRLVGAAMPLVLGRVDQQVAVELADVVLGERDRVIGAEDRLHHLGVAGDLLLVAGGERADADVGEQSFDLTVAEVRAFDPGRGADALDGSDMAEARQPLRRDPTDRSPRALELVDLRDQRQDFGRDAKSRDVERHTDYPPIYTRS